MGKKFRYFTVLGDMRTGSNLFESHINQFEDIVCAGELFNVHFVGFPSKEEAFGVTLQQREKEPLTLIDQMVAQSPDFLPGFRLFSDHDPRVLDYCLRDPSCAKIVLTRNVLSSFISLKIAQATDQWKMMDFHKRKNAQVHFDIHQFQAFFQKRSLHGQHIRRVLQTTGQTAFHLDYDDINNLEVINGAAAYLGSAVRLEGLKEKLKRQNPQSLEDKVSNFAEMKQQLATLDVFAEQKHIPLEADRKPGVWNFVGGTSVPVLYTPILESIDPRIAPWIAAHDPSGAKADFNRKDLSAWLTRGPNHQIFTVLSHPVERAYIAFEHKIFANSKKTMMGLRTMLERNYGLIIPEEDQLTNPNCADLETSGYDLTAHRNAFIAFIEFLRGNLIGQTRAKIDNAWATQTSLIHGLNKVAHPHHILRPDQLAMGLRQIELSLGLEKQTIPPFTPTPTCFPLSEIYNGDIEARIRDIYSQDYRLFGFASWANTRPN